MVREEYEQAKAEVAQGTAASTRLSQLPTNGAKLDYRGIEGSPVSDLMTGFLRAASHGPGFATELFGRDDLADYLLSDRAFYHQDRPNECGGGDGSIRAREALGSALFAAGSGVDPDHPTSYVEQTEARRQVLTGTLHRLSAQDEW
ncbi:MULTISPECIES: hypothetical protein [unclassified Streptomyces]|uniref:hypothetical protein n=1 Tax=unclassified Streptomyces TaxID=2593676 RepID=UPI0036E17613